MFVVCLFIKSSIILWDENFNTTTFKQVIFGRLQNFDLSNSSQWQALSAAIIHTAKHLLKFCWCFCATIAQKSPQKSVNTTQIQRECPWIWSCACLRFYPYPEPKRAGGSLCGTPMFKLKMESYIFPEYADCQKTLVGASIARPCPFACERNLPGKGVAAPSWRVTNGRP